MDVVLVHSGVTDSREWEGVKPLLEREHSVLALDLPGHGERAWEPGEVSLADVVLEPEFARAALVGVSFGARAVLEAALQAPERVSALVLVSANVFGWSEEVAANGAREEELFDAGRFDEAAELMVASWLAGPHRRPEDVDATLRARVRAMQVRAYELEDADATVKRVEPDLSRVASPTLLIRGALDFDDVARASERFLAELPDAREVVFDDCAHLPAMEQPERFAAVLLEFLAPLR
jgi:3-oxoadipate enol-lactonase